jgi:hypothetical protein
VVSVLTALGAWIAPGRVIRQIPNIDLVEIKSYPTTNRVTVVLDDERTKRKQAVAVSPKK